MEPTFKIDITADEDGAFCATCPALPSVITQGATREEAEANAREAIALALECGDVPL